MKITTRILFLAAILFTTGCCMLNFSGNPCANGQCKKPENADVIPARK